MIRSTTDEMLAARFDPEPWLREDGLRFAYRWQGEGVHFDPRPEFIPSRDPEPYRCGAKSGYELRHQPSDISVCPDPIFAPRPEFARPGPNPILVDIRKYRAERQGMNNPKGWGRILRAFEGAASDNPWGATPAQIEDARKVLTRFVGVFG